MADETLDAYIRQTIAADSGSPSGVLFTWQGGEPTLMGLDFFRRAVALQKKYTAGRPFQNTFQTNGTLRNDAGCAFFAENHFLVGLSLDGPQFVHDHHRLDAGGKPTFERVFKALKLLQKHEVETNVLACVSRLSSQYPLEIYNFFKESGVTFIQFSPIVERPLDEVSRSMGLRLAMPPDFRAMAAQEVTPWSVEPEAFGDFYMRIFDEWVRHDVGKIFVMNFEWTLLAAWGGHGAVCTMSESCGDACIVEHNGDLYSCDHFVYPEFRLGNILTDDVRALVHSASQHAFGARKEKSLPSQCKCCDVLCVCRGGCPKHRFMQASDGAPSLNYLCKGYKKFYAHTAKYMTAFIKLLEMDLPLEWIMEAIKGPLVIPASAKTGHQQVVLWIK